MMNINEMSGKNGAPYSAPAGILNTQEENLLSETARMILSSNGPRPVAKANGTSFSSSNQISRESKDRLSAVHRNINKILLQSINRLNTSLRDRLDGRECEIHRICRQKDIDIEELKRVLTASPNQVNALTREGETPLHLLLRNSASLEGAKLLISYKADTNITSSSFGLDEFRKAFSEGLGGIRLTCMTPIEEAFFLDSSLFNLLIQTRPHKNDFTKKVVEECISHFSKPRNEAYELIDQCINQLTCLDIKDIFEKCKYRYQAHLLSVRGYAGEGSLYEMKILLSIVAGEKAGKIKKMIDVLEIKEDRDLFNKLIQENSELIKRGVDEGERYNLLKDIYNKTQRSNDGLEGFTPLFYLPLRLRSLLRAFYALAGDIDRTDGIDRKTLEKILFREILLASEAHREYFDLLLSYILVSSENNGNPNYIDDKFKSYEKTKFQVKDAIDACVENLHSKISALAPKDNYYIATGFTDPGHAIYVDFTMAEGNKLCIRIDNLGGGSQYHENITELSAERQLKSARKKTHRTIEDYFYPYALECNTVDFQKGDAKIYLFYLMMAQFQEAALSIKWLYANHAYKDVKHIPFLTRVSLTDLQARYPSKRHQSVGNCVVKNNQIGFQIRALLESSTQGSFLYRWFRAVEVNCLGLKSWPQVLKKLVNASYLQGLDKKASQNNDDERKDGGKDSARIFNDIIKGAITEEERQYLRFQLQELGKLRMEGQLLNNVKSILPEEQVMLTEPEDLFDATVEKLSSQKMKASEFIQTYTPQARTYKYNPLKILLIGGWLVGAIASVHKVMPALKKSWK